MTEEIEDFETENLISTFKFRLTNWTLDQYAHMGEILGSQKNCLKDKCLGVKNEQKFTNFADLQHCVKNCEAGIGELLAMQNKHCEVARLTYIKNISRCEIIHGNVRLNSAFIDDDD